MASRAATLVARAASLCGLAGLAAPTLALGSRPEILGIEEPAGVTRFQDQLFLVGDDDPGAYFSMKVKGDEMGLVPLHPKNLKRHALKSGIAALDLESVDVLPNGRVIVLSERVPGLFDEDGMLVLYGRRFMEFGGRGPEGLAMLPDNDGGSRVAVLWEGGYPEGQDLPPELEAELSLRALAPRVLVHHLEKDAKSEDRRVRGSDLEVTLQVPKPVGDEPFAQRFRAPDLVWHRVGGPDAEWGWIVLLSSGWSQAPVAGSSAECSLQENGRPIRWCYRFLQRFDIHGAPVGDPFDLDTVLPEHLRTANWEGLGWFDPGKKLILVYDESIADRRVNPQQAFVMELPAGW